MDTPCIPWTGRIRSDGYGTIGADLAHRRLWLESGRELKPGETLDHLCHDPHVCRLGNACPHRQCVNLAHLEAVSADENKRRGGSRCAAIERCPEGHEYAGENLMVSGGKRYCRTCRRAKQQAIRQAAKDARCRAAGHEPPTTPTPSGRSICRTCFGAAHSRR